MLLQKLNAVITILAVEQFILISIYSVLTVYFYYERTAAQKTIQGAEQFLYVN